MLSPVFRLLDMLSWLAAPPQLPLSDADKEFQRLVVRRKQDIVGLKNEVHELQHKAESLEHVRGKDSPTSSAQLNQVYITKEERKEGTF